MSIFAKLKLFIQITLKLRVPWRVVLVVMDDLDLTVKAITPIKEAIAFIEQFSRFKIVLTILQTNIPHTLDTWSNGAVIMLRDNIPTKYINLLPVADSYMFLYDTHGLSPAQGGSTMGVADGILKNGKRRPYATIAANAWWYPNPVSQFTSEGAHIAVHEAVNTINCVLEVPPYNFPTMVVGNDPDAYIYERGRLESMAGIYYDKLLRVLAVNGEI